jgi:hypothetical protein
MKILATLRSTACNPLRNTSSGAYNTCGRARAGEPARDKRHREATAALAAVFTPKKP